MVWWVLATDSLLQAGGTPWLERIRVLGPVFLAVLTLGYVIKRGYFAYKMGSNHAGVPVTLARLLFTRRADTGEVNSNTQETITVEGKTESLGEPLETPYSEEPTLAVRWDVYDIEREHTWWSRLLHELSRVFRGRYVPLYKGIWTRKDVEDGREAEPFVIDDGSGPLLVDPSGAQFVFATDTMPEEYGGTSRRYDEFYLEPDQFAVAAGTIVPTSQLDHDIDVSRADLPDYALTAPGDGQLRLADTDKFGLAYRLPRWNLSLAGLVLLTFVLLYVVAPI